MNRLSKGTAATKVRWNDIKEHLHTPIRRTITYWFIHYEINIAQIRLCGCGYRWTVDSQHAARSWCCSGPAAPPDECASQTPRTTGSDRDAPLSQGSAADTHIQTNQYCIINVKTYVTSYDRVITLHPHTSGVCRLLCRPWTYLSSSNLNVYWVKELEVRLI